MKVLCLFSTDFMPWVIARHWLIGLANVGFEVHVACPAGPYVHELQKAGLRVQTVYFNRNLNPLLLIRSFISVARIIHSTQWDILNCQGPAAGLVGRLACILSFGKRPLVLTTNHGYYFDEHMHRVRRRLAILTERFLGSVTDFTMFVSAEDHSAAIRERIVKDPSRAITILNGIDLERFPGRPRRSQIATARARIGISADAEVIGIVGRLIVEKGLREFFAAAAQLCDARPKLHVVVVGDVLPKDRDPWKDQLREKVIQAGLSDRFRFTGCFTPDVYEYLSVLDVLVHPSYKESFGRVIAEGMAAGLPVVATNVRGCRELVIHGETGLLVPHRNVTALTEAIRVLLDDRAMRERMGAAGRARVVERYDEQQVVQRFVTCISARAGMQNVYPHVESLTEMSGR